METTILETLLSGGITAGTLALGIYYIIKQQSKTLKERQVKYDELVEKMHNEHINRIASQAKQHERIVATIIEHHDTNIATLSENIERLSQSIDKIFKIISVNENKARKNQCDKPSN